MKNHEQKTIYYKQKNGSASSPACRKEKFQRIFPGARNNITCGGNEGFCGNYQRKLITDLKKEYHWEYE